MASWLNKHRHSILTVCIALLPTVLTIGLVQFWLHGSLANSHPTYMGEMNDAIHNWREIYTFSEVGFNSGYFTINEWPARASFTHYYAYGPFYPAFYGVIGHFLGWYTSSPIVYHFVLITTALLLCFFVLKFNVRQLLCSALLLSTFWPLLFYLPTNMMELPHQAGAIVLSIFFYCAIKEHGILSKRMGVAGTVFLITLSLLRFTWIFLLLPFLLLGFYNGKWRRTLFIIVIFLVIAGCAFTSYTVINSPYPYDPNHPSAILANLSKIGFNALFLAGNVVLTNVFRNFIGTPIELAERLVMFSLLGYLSSAALQHIRRRRRTLALSGPEIFFHVLNIGFIVGFVIIFYFVGLWHDFRFFASPLLLSLVLLIAFQRYRIVVLVAAVNFLVIGSFLANYQETWKQQLAEIQPSVDTFKTSIESVLIYDPQAKNAWCNTLLYRISKEEAFRMPPELLLGIHPGLGISYFIKQQQGDLALPPKSKYLLFNSDTYNAFADKLHVRLLTTTSVGDLYLNLDANCDS